MILSNEIQEIKWKPTVFQLADYLTKKGTNSSISRITVFINTNYTHATKNIIQYDILNNLTNTLY